MRKLLTILFLTVSFFANAQTQVSIKMNDTTIQLPLASLNLSACVSLCGANPVSMNWKIIAGNAITLSNTTGLNTTIFPVYADTYYIEFAVNDDKGKRTADTLTINFTAPPNKLPTASIQPVSNITLPTNTNILDGSKSIDADGTIKTYLWTQTSGNPATIQLPNNSMTTIGGLAAGAYTFRLTVTDNAGGVSSSVVSFSVAPAVVVPVAKKIVINVYDQNGNILSTQTINL